jgi:hypothetical protein
MQEKLVLSGSMPSGKLYGCRAIGLLYEGIFTNDDGIMAHLDSLWMVGSGLSFLSNLSIVMVQTG